MSTVRLYKVRKVHGSWAVYYRRDEGWGFGLIGTRDTWIEAMRAVTWHARAAFLRQVIAWSGATR